MFMFDVETLGKQTDSIILSFAAIYFNPDEKPSPQELFESAFFAKLDVKDQSKRLNRKLQKSTVEWWAKQCENVKVKSFYPNKNLDEKFEDAYERMREWVDSKNDPKCAVWARGSLDQLILDSMTEQLNIKPIWWFSQWRDVRTALDFLCGTNSGYVDVDYPGFDPQLHITKHNPVDDCVYDIMQLVYGKK